MEEPDFPCAKMERGFGATIGTVQLLPKWLSMARSLKAWRLMGSTPNCLGIPWLVKGLIEGHRVLSVRHDHILYFI